MNVLVVCVDDMNWYIFDQNNSGGRFVVDDVLCARLYIEALNEDDACERAERLGVYFDGVDEGTDCECCGDRWYRPWNPVDLSRGGCVTIEEYAYRDMNSCSGIRRKAGGRIFYADGRVVDVVKETN